VAKDIKTEGLSDAAIRKAAVTAALGDAAVAGKAEAYIDARFDILVEDAAKKAGGQDQFAAVIKNGIQPTNDAMSGLSKADADAFNSMSDEDKKAFVEAEKAKA
jgi:hypothetical protein